MTMKTTTTKPTTRKTKPKPAKGGKKPPAPGTTGKRKERPMSVRHERFCEFIAAGESQTDAYLHAGWNVTRKSARVNASELLTKPNIEARIAALRAKTAAKLDMKREDLARGLMEAFLTPVGKLDANHPLAQEFTKDKDGKIRIRGVGKIEAARLLCEMMGWKEPEKITVDAGPNTLEAIRERARSFKSPLNRRHAEG